MSTPVQSWVLPVTLPGRRVRMEPLAEHHLADLELVAFDAPIWRWTIAGEQDAAGLKRWLDAALANAATGSEMPFATIDQATGRAIGSSRDMTIAPAHRRLEIGWSLMGAAPPPAGGDRGAQRPH